MQCVLYCIVPIFGSDYICSSWDEGYEKCGDYLVVQRKKKERGTWAYNLTKPRLAPNFGRSDVTIEWCPAPSKRFLRSPSSASTASEERYGARRGTAAFSFPWSRASFPLVMLFSRRLWLPPDWTTALWPPSSIIFSFQGHYLEKTIPGRPSVSVKKGPARRGAVRSLWDVIDTLFPL